MKQIKNIDLKILTSFSFLVGLFTLLLNDFILKGIFGNWFTGKISDFAGLFVFSIFWATLFPKQSKKVFWIVGLLFIFWKSIYSQTIIDLWNTTGILQIGRVVDFTDLIALSILPIAYMFFNRQDNMLKLNLNPIFPLAIAVFSFCATSRATYSPEFNETYNFDFSKQELVRKINIVNSNNNFLNNRQISLNIDNANDFQLDDYNIDTLWYYSSSYDTIYDTLWTYNRNGENDPNFTSEIDTIYKYIHSTKDTLYINQNGLLFYQIPIEDFNSRTAQTYNYNSEAKLRINGNDNKSSITLLQLRNIDDSGDQEEHKKKLLHDFEVNFIDKIKNAH